MKVQVCRASGNPLLVEQHESYKEEYRAMYDKVANHVTKGQPTKMNQKQAERGDKLMERFKTRLLRKYPPTGTWDIKPSKKELQKLVAHYGPIALATGHDGKLALVIMDNGFEA